MKLNNLSPHFSLISSIKESPACTGKIINSAENLVNSVFLFPAGFLELQRNITMRNLLVLLSFLFLINPLSSLAQIEGSKFFLEGNYGRGFSLASQAMRDFYRTFSLYSVDLGYMLTPHFGIVPISISWREFSFDKDKYRNRLLESMGLKRESEEGVVYRLRNLSTFEAVSNRKEVSFSPGVVLITPVFAKLRGFCQIGAGIYHTRILIDNSTLEGWLPGRGSKRTDIIKIDGKDYYRDIWTSKESSNNFVLLFSGGVDFGFTEKITFTLKCHYNLIFTEDKSFGEENKDGLRFYYSTEDGLKSHHLYKDENMSMMEFRAGLKYYFGH